MKYVKAQGETVLSYPYTLAMMRADNPNVSYPKEASAELLAEYGVYQVAEIQRPVNTITQDAIEQQPQLIGGQWTQVWAMVDVSPEVAAQRQKRATEAAEKEAIKLDTFVQNFIAMTPAQVEAYVANNTSNLAQVQALLTKMALMLLVLAKREFR